MSNKKQKKKMSFKFFQLFLVALILMFLELSDGKTRSEWLNGVDFSQSTEIRIIISKQSDFIFQLSPSRIFLDSEKSYSLTLVSSKGTNDSIVFTSNAFFSSIALDSGKKKKNLKYFLFSGIL